MITFKSFFKTFSKASKSLLVAFFLVVGTLGTAQASSYCKKVYSLSANIQEARQLGLSLVDSLAIAEKIHEDSPAGRQASQMTQEIVLRAYEIHRYSTKEYQQKAIQSFAEREYLNCMKNST